MGGIGVGLALIIISMILCVFLRSSNCLVEARNQAKVAEGNISHKLHRSPILFCGPGRFICCKPVDQTDGESSSDQITAPKPSSNQSNYLFACTLLSKNMHTYNGNQNYKLKSNILVLRL